MCGTGGRRPGAAGAPVAPPDSTSDDVLVRLAGTEVSLAELVDWAGHSSAVVREQVAKHARAPKDALEVLSRDPNAKVRAAAVGREGISPAVLVRAATTDPEWPVRKAACAHPGLPVEAMRRVADRDPLARSLASNPSLPEDMALQFAGHCQTGVRVMIAQNPALPDAALQAMKADAIAAVRNAARAEIARRTANRIARRFGVRADNAGAIEVLASMNWQELDPESEAVDLIRALHPDDVPGDDRLA